MKRKEDSKQSTLNLLHDMCYYSVNSNSYSLFKNSTVSEKADNAKEIK